MGRLIDADKLKTDLEKAISKNEDMDCLDFLRAASVIDAQPTAYNSGEVVEQLEDRKNLMLETFKISESDIDRGRIYGMDKAIEIVKAGGVDA